jgi:hypothetical protein
MGFLSDLFGSGESANAKLERDRAEAASLNEEVAENVNGSIELIRAESARLLKRCAAISPDDGDLALSCLNSMNLLKGQADQVLAQTHQFRENIASSGKSIDWNRLLRMLEDWKITSLGLRQSVVETVRKLDGILDQAGSLKA